MHRPSLKVCVWLLVAGSRGAVTLADQLIDSVIDGNVCAVFGECLLIVDGARISGDVNVVEEAFVEVQGGLIGGSINVLPTDSFALISGGRVDGDLTLLEFTSASVIGGSIGGDVHVDFASLELRGGSIEGQLMVGGMVDVFGTGLEIRLDPGSEDTGVITGTLEDGTSLGEEGLAFVLLREFLEPEVALHDLNAVEVLFRRGDANDDGAVDASDGVAILAALFLGTDTGRCARARDVDDDGRIDLTDAVRVLHYVFAPGAEPPAAPFLDCGLDETPDELTCELVDSCSA